ncbi:hypothetical protein ACFYOR_25830 [Streptomyces griseofuscus]|uniref:hypothetical protein n=1 Tax=Streptomyces griseofuscus TaxID=146922 RepID=UPI0036CC1E67
MAMITTRRGQVALWLGAALTAVTTVGLAAVAILADLDTADRVASLTGSVLAAAGLAFSVYTLFASPGSVPVNGARSVQAGSSVGRAVTGDNNHLQGPVPGAGAIRGGTVGDVPPAGERGVSAGGGIGEAVTGDGNQLT